MLVNEQYSDILALSEILKSGFNDARLSLYTSRLVSFKNGAIATRKKRTPIDNKKVLLLMLIYMADTGKKQTCH